MGLISVIPHLMRNLDFLFFWIPASAGMTTMTEADAKLGIWFLPGNQTPIR